MIPALALGVGSQLWAYAETKSKLYITSALSLVSIGAYTGVVLSEDISQLRSSSGSSDNAVVVAKHFCKYHHPRLGFALFSAGCSLWALTFPKKKKID